MPPKRRSRGCQQCRKRRVKCDERADYCKQCVRLGLQCSGPVQGNLFVDMTDSITERVAHRHNSELIASPAVVYSPKETTPMVITRDLITTSSSVKQSKVPSLRNEKDYHRYLTIHEPLYPIPVSLPPPERSLIQEQIYLARYIDFSRAPLAPNHSSAWTLSTSEQAYCARLPAFKLCLQAASMAFYAYINHDARVQAASFRLYVAGLNSYRQLLSTPVSCFKRLEVPEIGKILIPVFLSMFEIVSCTSAVGCFLHLYAACSIMYYWGPEKCQTGTAHQLFLSMRIANASVALTEGTPSMFSSEEWQTIPFGGRTPPLLHRIINVLLQIPAAIEMDSRHFLLRDLPFSLPSLFDQGENVIEQRCVDLLAQLRIYWREFEIENTEQADCSARPDPQFSPTTFIYSDTFTAYVVSMFDAASLILHFTLYAVSSNPCNTHLAQAISHAESILLISKYEQESSLIGFDLIRSTFPIKVVESIGPGDAFREEARRMGKDWGKMGLRGIVEIMPQAALVF